MKKRSDFVSNSSSSSFIVADEGDVWDRFKEEHLDWKAYVDKFLEREVCDPIYSMSYSWSSYSRNEIDPAEKIRVLSEGQLVEAYGRNASFTSIWPAVLERDAGMVEKISGAIKRVREVDSENEPDLFKNGQKSQEFANAWRQAHWVRRQKAEDELYSLVAVVKEHIAAALEPVYGGWKFWYAEFGNDGNGIDEDEAFDNLDNTKWHRVFNNH